MKAIDTTYRGFRFRSRLEARWAVFMDYINVPFEYEREGYDLGGIFYLPDFWLPELRYFLEIKPESPSAEEREKATRLTTQSGFPVFVLVGQPECPNVDTRWYENESQAEIYIPPEPDRPTVGCDFHYLWCECPNCGRIDLQFDGRADRIKCKCPPSAYVDKGYNYNSARLRLAYDKAKSYRFEPSARQAVARK